MRKRHPAMFLGMSFLFTESQGGLIIKGSKHFPLGNLCHGQQS